MPLKAEALLCLSKNSILPDLGRILFSKRLKELFSVSALVSSAEIVIVEVFFLYALFFLFGQKSVEIKLPAAVEDEHRRRAA